MLCVEFQSCNIPAALCANSLCTAECDAAANSNLASFLLLLLLLLLAMWVSLEALTSATDTCYCCSRCSPFRCLLLLLLVGNVSSGRRSVQQHGEQQASKQAANGVGKGSGVGLHIAGWLAAYLGVTRGINGVLQPCTTCMVFAAFMRVQTQHSTTTEAWGNHCPPSCEPVVPLGSR